MGGLSISLQKAISAAKGNPDLLDVLMQLQSNQQQQSAVTGTTPVAGVIAGQPNPSAPVPSQATGTVSILGGAYVVQLVNPGATSAISALQASQAAGKATSLTPLQPLTPIYHQIRASTSAAFNVNSNTQIFGGNTGSTQVYWTLTGLGKGTWYIQFRSSFDGVNFNNWRNANGGTALGGLINQVTEENAGNANWALFTLPGNLITGIAEGFCADGEVFDLAEQVYSSGMMAIAGPNSYTQVGNSTYGVTECDVVVTTPSQPVVGIPDLPVVIQMEYGEAHAAPNYWPGNATVFAIAFDPSNPAVTLYTQAGSTWAVFVLPGGARITIGMGKNYDGDAIPVPAAITWFDWSRAMSICSLTGAVDTGFTPHGYLFNQINAGTLAAQYMDASNIWSSYANWLVIGWETGTNVQTVAGSPWLIIELQGGHAMAIGAGQLPNGSSVTLPTGFTVDNLLSICTPAGFDPVGHHFQGIGKCALFGLTPILQYIDDSFNTWSGPSNWMAACWK